MEALGTSNGDQNGGISWTSRDTPPGALQGRVSGGFWMDLGTISGGFWTDLEAGGAQIKTKMNEFRGHFATTSQEPSRGGLGTVLDGFGKVLEGFRMSLGGF